VLVRAEGRELLAIHRPASSAQPSHVVTLQWQGDEVSLIRDYRYVPYLVGELALEAVDLQEGSHGEAQR
jgi:hypothetical protein